jgi:uncharacterized Zn finger protein (UPF0148 family)
MIRKYCPACGEYSYSSSPYGEWLCPACDQDLTNEEAESELLAEARESFSAALTDILKD